MKHFSLTISILAVFLLSSCGKTQNEIDPNGDTIIEFKSSSKHPERWVLQLGSPVVKSVQFETDKKGRAEVNVLLDTVYPAYFFLPADNFIVKTWLHPGERCKVTVDKKAKLQNQIVTTGVFAERTKASISDEYGYFYQLAANDNFLVPLEGDENEYGEFLIKSYNALLDTINRHQKWNEAVRELALKTLNDKQYFRIYEPDNWLNLCKSLRSFKGETSPKELSSKKEQELYDLTIGLHENK